MATVYPFRHPLASLRDANARQGSSRHPDRFYSDPHHPASDCTFNFQHRSTVKGLDACLRNFETTARENFRQAIVDIPDMHLEDWFARQLNSRIIPALSIIGFDESFSRLLFQAAASSWQRMGPFTNKCIWFYPNLIKNLKAVRNGMISIPERRSETSWIILPRVFHFLEEEHAVYLLCYLKFLTSESPSEFRKILTRIIIEFVANYALKYRSCTISGCRMDSALFYGFEAMFWKILRDPPRGFEDDLIFNHCLRWLKLFQSKCSGLNDGRQQSIRLMEVYRQKVIPTGDALRLTHNDNPDLGNLLVTLRHGRPGMKAATDFMRNWLYSPRKDSEGRSLSSLLPSALNKFFSTIKIELPAESPQFKNSLKKFLHGIRENCILNGVDQVQNPIEPPEQFRFVIQRVQRLVDGAAVSLA